MTRSSTRTPTHCMTTGLLWTRHGTVWADWLLSGVPYGLLPQQAKKDAAELHTALFRGLLGESVLQSVAVPISSESIVARMLDGLGEVIDQGGARQWTDECADTLDTLDALQPGTRVFRLLVPLRLGTWDILRQSGGAAERALRETLNLPGRAPQTVDVTRYQAAADRVVDEIPWIFDPQPTTPAQQVWFHLHHLTRGLGDDPLPVDPIEQQMTVTSLAPRLQSGTALPDPLLDEGDTQSLDAHIKRIDPSQLRRRRYVRVENPHTTESPSYQSFVAITRVPDLFPFPGAEVLGRIDESGVPDIDWCIHAKTRPGAAAAADNNRAMTNLVEQSDQRDTDLTQSSHQLSRVKECLVSLTSTLEGDDQEVEIQPTISFAVGGTTPAQVVDRQEALIRWLKGLEYSASAPAGEQSYLFSSWMAGARRDQVITDFAQITTSQDLACMVPLASHRGGDRRGSLLGIDITDARHSVVLHDAEGMSEEGVDRSGSVACNGEQGAGKSHTLKKLAGDAVDRCSRAIVIDHTVVGEYTTWALSIDDAIVVDLSDPAWSLDPLRLFPDQTATPMLQGLLAMLGDIAPNSALGGLLSRTLDPAHRQQHSLHTSGAIFAHIFARAQDDPAYAELGDRLRQVAQSGLAKAFIDQTLPVPDFYQVPAMVIRTHTVTAPRDRDLQHEHLFRQLPPDKIWGRAIFAYLAKLTTEFCFADRSRMDILLCDEIHHLTASPEGYETLELFFRDCRKHKAAAFVGSQELLNDVGETLLGLIPTVIQLRTSSETLAKRALPILDMHDEDESDAQAMIDLIRGLSPRDPRTNVVADHRRGEAILIRRGEAALKLRVLPPSNPRRAAACKSSTPRQRRSVPLSKTPTTTTGPAEPTTPAPAKKTPTRRRRVTKG